MPDPVPIRLTVNGQVREGRSEPRKLLVDFIREDLGLTEIGRASCRERVYVLV